VSRDQSRERRLGLGAAGCEGLLLAALGAAAACGWFGCALNTAATFDVFYRLQVTNYGLFYIFLQSAPNGPNLIDVWVF
jgi:hypothetical protein